MTKKICRPRKRQRRFAGSPRHYGAERFTKQVSVWLTPAQCKLLRDAIAASENPKQGWGAFVREALMLMLMPIEIEIAGQTYKAILSDPTEKP